MFNFIKKLGNKIKNIVKRTNYKKLYEETIRQQQKNSEEMSELIEKIKRLEAEAEENRKKLEDYERQNRGIDYGGIIKRGDTIQDIRLDLLEKLFNRGDVQLGKHSTNKPNRYLTTNPEFLDKWYEVIEKDKQGVEPWYNITPHLRIINKTLTYNFGDQAIFESYEYDNGDWQLLVLEQAMNKVFIAFDISPAIEDNVVRG